MTGKKMKKKLMSIGVPRNDAEGIRRMSVTKNGKLCSNQEKGAYLTYMLALADPKIAKRIQSAARQ